MPRTKQSKFTQFDGELWLKHRHLPGHPGVLLGKRGMMWRARSLHADLDAFFNAIHAQCGTDMDAQDSGFYLQSRPRVRGRKVQPKCGVDYCRDCYPQ